MNVIRRLRACWQHLCGRVLVLIFLLSLVGLFVLPQMVNNYAVAKIMSFAIRDQEDKNLTGQTQLGKHFQLTTDTNSTPLRLLSTPAGFPNVAVSLPTQMSQNTTETSTSKDSKLSNIEMYTSGRHLQNSSSAFQNDTHLPSTSKRYLIYVCDHTTYCYGIGDRQRGIVSVYFLAEVTHRSFGIIMTSPSNFTEFYKPNLVAWDIPKSELEGKSSLEILAYGPRVNLGLHEIDFNRVYPQDVVYIRTNQKWCLELLKNHHYRGKFPPWTKVPTWKLFQVAWLRLMVPTTTLRQELNAVLVQIVQDMDAEYAVWQNLNNTKCCQEKHMDSFSCNNKTCDSVVVQKLCCNVTSVTASTRAINNCDGQVCAETAARECRNITCPVVNNSNCNNKTCYVSVNTTSTGFTSNVCEIHIENVTTNTTYLARLKPFAAKYCNETRPVLKPMMSVESIRNSQGFDQVNLNLVCVHIRLGHSATLPREHNVRNKQETVHVVWEFLKPYVAAGQHVYLATDSQQSVTELKENPGTQWLGYNNHVTGKLRLQLPVK